MDVREILYPTDFSPCARHAFAHALELAQRYGARLHVVHVIALHSDLPYDPAFFLPSADAAYELVAREVAFALGGLAEQAKARGVETVIAQPRQVQVGPTLLAYARHHDVDLVVMGTRGGNGPARRLLGSLAAEVLRYSLCPVLVVRERDLEAGRPALPRLLLVPFDFSSSARQALAAAADLARRCGAALRLLHVLEGTPGVDADGGRTLTVAEQERLQATGQLRPRLRRELERLAPGILGEVVVVSGRVADAVVRASEEQGADLVVMACGGASAIQRLLFGSTAEAVVLAASVPVLVVKSDGTQRQRPPRPPAPAMHREEEPAPATAER